MTFILLRAFAISFLSLYRTEHNVFRHKGVLWCSKTPLTYLKIRYALNFDRRNIFKTSKYTTEVATLFCKILEQRHVVKLQLKYIFYRRPVAVLRIKISIFLDVRRIYSKGICKSQCLIVCEGLILTSIRCLRFRVLMTNLVKTLLS